MRQAVSGGIISKDHGFSLFIPILLVYKIPTITSPVLAREKAFKQVIPELESGSGQVLYLCYTCALNKS